MPLPAGPTNKGSERTLTLQNIGDLDQGRVAAAFNQALRLATLDVLDRPADKSKRKIQLQVELVPALDKDSAVLDTINTDFLIKSALPQRRSSTYPMLPTPDGKQLFQTGSPFDPRQQSFGFEDRPEHVNHSTGEVTPRQEMGEQPPDPDALEPDVGNI